jgi:hypothetical protein
MLIAIDPGVNGGVAWTDPDGIVHAEKMPETLPDLRQLIEDRLGERRPGDILSAIVEKTGTYVPGNSGPAAATFARHCGAIEGLLCGLRVPFSQVAPGVWMKAVCGVLPKEKKDRKKAIQEQIGRLYPHIRVTLSVADALGILTYGTAYKSACIMAALDDEDGA